MSFKIARFFDNLHITPALFHALKTFYTYQVVFQFLSYVINTTTGTNRVRLALGQARLPVFSMVVLETEIDEEHMESL